MAENPNRFPLPTDGNDRVIMGGVSSSDGFTPVPLEVDSLTGRLLVSSAGFDPLADITTDLSTPGVIVETDGVRTLTTTITSTEITEVWS